MSGGLIPYHLRRNKAIDRAIFMEFLTKLNIVNSISNYGYVGFGAVHMEDFKLIHSLFSINDLVCIEMDKLIHNRQQFNLPLGCIKLEHTTSDSFIAEFFPEKNYIVWLDYVSPKDLRQQLNEAEALIQKLNPYDVVKITLNCNPNSIVDEKQFRLRKDTLKEKFDINELLNTRLDILKTRVETVPHDITANMMTKKQYPLVLNRIIELVCVSALENSDNVFYPVLSFVYSDSQHQMLTLTGIILSKGTELEFSNRLLLNNWEYASTSWNAPPQVIDMPDLTLKERLAIDACLPCNDPEQIVSELKIDFDTSREKSIEKIKNYIRYYRHYPFFSKISV